MSHPLQRRYDSDQFSVFLWRANTRTEWNASFAQHIACFRKFVLSLRNLLLNFLRI